MNSQLVEKCEVCEIDLTLYFVNCKKHQPMKMCLACSDFSESDCEFYMFIQGKCGLCILEGDYRILRSLDLFGGGNYHERSSIALCPIELGQRFALFNSDFELPDFEFVELPDTQKNGMPESDIHCFRRLFTIGFNSEKYKHYIKNQLEYNII